jgi:hypothetical protein
VSEEGSTPYADPLTLYTNAELYIGSGNTFIVWVPTALALSAGQIAQLKGLVNLYKLPGRNYGIAFF